MQAVYGGEHLVDSIRRRARRQIASHAESELGFADAHRVALHRGGAAIGDHGVAHDPAGQWSRDIDVLLSGLARRRDLPAQHCPAERSLHGVTLGAALWPQRWVQRIKLGAVTPMSDEEARCGGDLI